MQVIEGLNSKEILLQTVTIQATNTQNVIFFRCYKCGTGIAKVKGEIKRISAGITPTLEVTVINQCHECNTNYTFQTRIHVKHKDIRLTLSLESKLSTFHCVFCRSPLVQYNKDSAWSLPQRQIVQLPYSFTCIRSSCMRKYTLNDIVTCDNILE